MNSDSLSLHSDKESTAPSEPASRSIWRLSPRRLLRLAPYMKAPRSCLPLHPRVRSTASRAADLGAIALFDLDGTITRRDTYLGYLLGFLARHPEKWPRAALLPLAVLCHLAGWRGNAWLETTFLRAVLGGVPRSRLESWTKSFVDGLLTGGLSARRAPNDRATSRRRSSGSGHGQPRLLREPLSRRLGFDAVLCTRAAYDASGRVTGDLDGDNCYGEGKLRQVRRYLAEEAPGLPIVCYSDHHADLPLLRFATEPVVVNPSRRLKRLAIRQGITIENWNRSARVPLPRH
jgi:phosphatidylglycerophosphatase C